MDVQNLWCHLVCPRPGAILYALKMAPVRGVDKMATSGQNLRAEESPAVTTLRTWPSAQKNEVAGTGESLYFFFWA